MTKTAETIEIGDVIVMDPAKYGPGAKAEVLDVITTPKGRITLKLDWVNGRTVKNTYSPATVLTLA